MLEYGDPRTIQKHLPQIWETLADEVRKNKCLAFKKKAVAGLGGVRVASLGAVVTSKVRIINDILFDPTTVRGTQGGLNLDTVTQDIPRCLCGEALLKLSGKNIPVYIKLRILVSKADVPDAFIEMSRACKQDLLRSGRSDCS